MGKKSKKSKKSGKKNKGKKAQQSYEDNFDPQEYLAEIFDYLKRHSPSTKDFLPPPVAVDDKAFDLIENLQLEVSDWLDGCLCDEDYEDYVFDTFLEFIHRDWPHLWKWLDAILRASWAAIPPIDPGLSIDEQTIRAQCHFRRDDLAWLTMKLFSHILQTSRQTFRADSVKDTLTVFSESPGFHFVLARTWIAAAEWKYGDVYSQSVAGGVFDYASDVKALDEDSARLLALALKDSFTEDGMSFNSFIASRISTVQQKFGTIHTISSGEVMHKEIRYILDAFSYVTQYCEDVFRDTLRPGNMGMFSCFMQLLSKVNDQSLKWEEIAVESSRFNCLRHLYGYFERCFKDAPWWIEKAISEGFLHALARTAVLLRHPRENNDYDGKTERAATPFYEIIPRILNTIRLYMIYPGIANKVVSAVERINKDKELSLIFFRNGLRIGAEWQAIEEVVSKEYNITMREVSRLQNYESACSNKACVSKKRLIEHKMCSKCHVTYYCSKECQQKHWAAHKRDCKKHVAKQQEGYAPAISDFDKAYIRATITQDSDVHLSDTIMTLIMQFGLELKDSSTKAEKVVVTVDYRVSPCLVTVGNENSVPPEYRAEVLRCTTNSVLCGIIPEAEKKAGYYIKDV